MRAWWPFILLVASTVTCVIVKATPVKRVQGTFSDPESAYSTLLAGLPSVTAQCATCQCTDARNARRTAAACPSGWFALNDGSCYKAVSLEGTAQDWSAAVTECGPGTVASISDADVNLQLQRLCSQSTCWPGISAHPSSMVGYIATVMRCGRTAECWIGLRKSLDADTFTWAGTCLRAQDTIMRELCACRATCSIMNFVGLCRPFRVWI